jgi:hypothetical protein
VQGRLRS